LFLSHGSIYAAQIAWLLRKPHISFEDTFNFEQINLYKPFTKVILSSDYDHPELGRKDIRYAGYHELAYLHENKFKSDSGIIDLLKLKPDEKFVLLRFVAFDATHDKRHKGISKENKVKLFNDFSGIAKVLISSERELPAELEPYRIMIPPEKMHDVIAISDLLFSESATMTSEAAVLGVPAIYVDRKGRYYTKELEEKYNLVYNYSDSESDQAKAIEKGIEILSTDGIKEIWQKKRLRMLQDKIDVTDFLVWFIENYPESARIMKEDPGYQERFK
jgi:predicted glycosyltransferase